MGQKKITICWDMILDLFKATGSLYGLSMNPLPDDARLIRIIPTSTTRQVELVLESSEWPELPDGSHIPPTDEPFLFCTTPYLKGGRA